MLQRVCVFCLLSVVFAAIPLKATAAEKKLLGWNVQEVGKVLSALSDMKWRPIALKGYASGNESLFDITWETNAVGGWYIYGDVKAEGFASRNAEYEQQGYRLAVKQSWFVGSEERFAGIWYPK